MAGLPKVSECPIRDKETGKCMCMTGACACWKDTISCSSVRCAYAFGYDTAKMIYTAYLDKAKEMIGTIFDKIKENEKDGDGDGT